MWGNSAAYAYLIKAKQVTDTVNVDDLFVLGRNDDRYVGEYKPLIIKGSDVLDWVSNNIQINSEPVTYLELKALVDNGELIPDKIYHITDRDIFIKAQDTNTLETEGLRRFKIINPKAYDNNLGVMGIWGSTQTYSLNDYVIWNGSLWQNLTGTNTTTSPDQDPTNWVYLDRNSNTMSGSDYLYVDKIFVIKYTIWEIENGQDFIWEQRDEKNIITRIPNSPLEFLDYTDWGSPFIYNNNVGFGIFNNKGNGFSSCVVINNNCPRGIFNNENVNRIDSNKGLYIIDNKNYNFIWYNECPISENNGTYGTGKIEFNSIEIDGIENNVVRIISRNSNSGPIVSNNCFSITNNSNKGGIGSNTGNINISNNSNIGQIDLNTCNVLGNSNLSFIRNNTITGNIESNSNSGRIEENSIDGDIHLNSNNGDITNNLSNITGIMNNNNNGDIRVNNNLGPISFNSNGGSILSNTNQGNVFRNSNHSDISNNSNAGDIEENKNRGVISNNSNNGGITTNMNNGDVLSNSIGGPINSNSNNGSISGNLPNNNGILNNSNNGYINSNNNNGAISFNSCAGDIDSNTCVGGIWFNSNGSSISSNSNIGDIEGNKNTESISGNSNNGYIVFNGNNGSINTNTNKIGNIGRNTNGGGIAFNTSTLAGPFDIQYNNNNGNINKTNITANILGTQVDIV